MRGFPNCGHSGQQYWAGWPRSHSGGHPCQLQAQARAEHSCLWMGCRLSVPCITDTISGSCGRDRVICEQTTRSIAQRAPCRSPPDRRGHSRICALQRGGLNCRWYLVLVVIRLGLVCHGHVQQTCQLCIAVSVRIQALCVDDQVIPWSVKVGESGPASKAVVFVEGACSGIRGRAAGFCHQQSAIAGGKILLHLIEQCGGHAVALH